MSQKKENGRPSDDKLSRVAEEYLGKAILNAFAPRKKLKRTCILRAVHGHCGMCDMDNALRETIDTTQEGKVITETNHPDGRKDVHVEVNMLDVKETDEATAKAKEAIENKVFPKLAAADVLVIVVHKPTNEHTERIVKLPNVRKYAEVAVASFRNQVIDAKDEDFLVVEHHITNGTVQVTTL